MERAGYARPIDVSSTRAGFIPGTHTVGFDGPADTIDADPHGSRPRGVRARRAGGGALAEGQAGVVYDARLLG